MRSQPTCLGPIWGADIWSAHCRKDTNTHSSRYMNAWVSSSITTRLCIVPKLKWKCDYRSGHLGVASDWPTPFAGILKHCRKETFDFIQLLRPCLKDLSQSTGYFHCKHFRWSSGLKVKNTSVPSQVIDLAVRFGWISTGLLGLWLFNKPLWSDFPEVATASFQLITDKSCSCPHFKFQHIQYLVFASPTTAHMNFYCLFFLNVCQDISLL